MSHNNELQLENAKIKGAANKQSESVTPIQLKQPAVSIQCVASDKSITEELQLDKEQHNSNVEETKIMASYPAVPPEDGGFNGQNSIQGKFSAPNALSFSIPKNIQRSEKAPPLQFAKQMDGIESVAEDKSTNSNGLPQAIQSKFENALGADFSDVKIHTNSKSATEVGALAYTQGTDVHFAPGQFEPNSNSGQELLGHELTHVIQQRAGRVQPTTEVAGLSVNDDDGLEAEADEGGRKVVQGKFESEGNKIESKPENNSPKIKSLPMQMKLGQGVIQRDEPQGQQTTTPQRRSDQERVNEVVNHLRGERNVVTRGGDIRIQIDEHTCVRLLRENHDVINEIKSAFDGNLKTYIKDNFTDCDYKIKATALLYEPTYLAPWTQVALCLIPPLTRDAEFYRIMDDLSPDQRDHLRNKYNEYFSQLGAGGLQQDIHADFNGADYHRAHILAFRSLTDADNLYLVTAGQFDTDVDTVLRIIRRVWGYGFSAFQSFLSQWNPTGSLPDVEHAGSSATDYFDTLPFGGINSFNVVGNHGLSLMYTTLSELSGAAKASVQAIFLEYINQLNENIRIRRDGERQVSGWGFTFEEESRLRIARADLEAGESGIDDTDQINEAISRIVAVYQSRVTRLEGSHSPDADIRAARNELESTRQRLLRDHQTSWTGVAEDAQLRLYELNDGDRLWLLRGNHSAFNEMVRTFFVKDQIENLRHQCIQPHEEGAIGSQTIRRGFNIIEFIRTTDPHFFLLGSDAMSRRGKRYLDQYLRDINSQNLTIINDFLLHSEFNSELLEEILERYPRHQNNTGRPLTNKSNFILHLRSLHFDDFSNFPRIRDAFDPASDGVERHRRAIRDREHDREVGGFLGDPTVAVSDALSGEDSQDIVAASIDRLSIFAEETGINSETLLLFRNFYGVERDLSSMEMEEFRACLSDLQNGRSQVAAITRDIVVTVISAVCSATPLGPFGGALAGEITGIILNELMDAEHHEAMSADNLERIVISLASAGTAQYLEEGASGARLLLQASDSPYVRAAIREGVQAAVSGSATLLISGLRGRLNWTQITEQIEGAILSAITGGLLERFGIPSTDQSFRRALIREVTNNVAQNIAEEGGALGHELVVNGRLDDDALARMIEAAAEGLRDGVLEHTGEHVGESVRDRIRSHRRGSEVESSISRLPEVSISTTSQDRSEHRDAIVPPAPTTTQDRRDQRDAIVPPEPINPQPAPISDSGSIRETIPTEDRDTIPFDDRETIPSEERDTIPSEDSETIPSEELETNHSDSDTLTSVQSTESSSTSITDRSRTIIDTERLEHSSDPIRRINSVLGIESIYNDMQNQITNFESELSRRPIITEHTSDAERIRAINNSLGLEYEFFVNNPNRATLRRVQDQLILLRDNLRNFNGGVITIHELPEGTEYRQRDDNAFSSESVAREEMISILRSDRHRELGIWRDDSCNPPVYRIFQGSTYNVMHNNEGIFTLIYHTHPNRGNFINDAVPSLADFRHIIHRRGADGETISSGIILPMGDEIHHTNFTAQFISGQWNFSFEIDLPGGLRRTVNIERNIVLNNDENAYRNEIIAPLLHEFSGLERGESIDIDLSDIESNREPSTPITEGRTILPVSYSAPETDTGLPPLESEHLMLTDEIGQSRDTIPAPSPEIDDNADITNIDGELNYRELESSSVVPTSNFEGSVPNFLQRIRDEVSSSRMREESINPEMINNESSDTRFSGYCANIRDESRSRIVNELAQRRVQANIYDYGIQGHQFLIVEINNQSFIFDPSLRQFVTNGYMGNEGNGQRINELRNRLPGINQFIIDMRIRGFVPFNQENLNYFIEIANTSSHENSFESDQEINESQSRELIANQEDMMSRLNFRGRDSIDNGSHRRIVHNSLNESDLTNNDNNPLSEAETSPSSSMDTIFNDIPTNSDGQTPLDPDEFASRPTSQVTSMDTIFNDMSTTSDGQTPLDPNQFVDSNSGNPGAIRMPNRSDLSDRRQHVEPTREYRDFECHLVNGLGARMGSSGFEGSGLGAHRSTISTPDGEREVVVKIYQNTSEFRDMLNMELESARVVSNTGYGPVVYGEIALVEPDLIGFAMGIAEGGFPDFADLDTFTPAERQRYTEEAERSASNISFLTIEDLNDFSNRLLRSGYYYEGEIQGFVDSQGHYNPIDFQALRPLSNEANERREQIQVHERNISIERDLLAEEAFNNLSRRTITP